MTDTERDETTDDVDLDIEEELTMTVEVNSKAVLRVERVDATVQTDSDT